MHPKLVRLSWILRIGFGAIFVVSGADKFSNLMAFWPGYISESFVHVIPFSAQTFMYLVGGIEVLIGLALLFVQPQLGGYAASAWMIAVAINLVMAGLYDLASRDVAIALGTFAAAQLAELAHGATGQRRDLAVPFAKWTHSV